jgi:uncharacterized protein YegP (UPF0339 family)
MSRPSAEFEFYRDAQKKWRWRVVARNGRIIAQSSEGYERVGKCRNSVKLTVEAGTTAVFSYEKGSQAQA